MHQKNIKQIQYNNSRILEGLLSTLPCSLCKYTPNITVSNRHDKVYNNFLVHMNFSTHMANVSAYSRSLENTRIHDMSYVQVINILDHQ